VPPSTTKPTWTGLGIDTFPCRDSSRDSSVVEHVLRLSVCIAVESDMVEGLNYQLPRTLKKPAVACFKTVSKYEVVSKTFRTGAAIYTAVVVARSTGTNRPNCEFQVLRRLRVNVRRCRPELWREQTWLLHHDKARPGQTLSVPEG
jgi:hypothetical protein